MKNVLISIVVPMYNSEVYIEDTINNLLGQTYKNIEILLIDDGSTDNTYQICENMIFKDNRIRLFKESNSGPSVARNFGIEKALGEYLIFVDSDDSIEKDLIYNCVCVFEKYKTDFVLFGMNFIYLKENKPYKIISKVINTDILYKKEDNSDFSYEFNILWDSNYLFSSCNKIYNLEFLLKNNLKFDVNKDSYEDLLFTIECILRSNSFYAINKTFYNYNHINKSSFSKKYKANRFEKMLEILNRLLYLTAVLNLSEEVNNRIYNTWIYIIFDSVKNELISKNSAKIKYYKVLEILKDIRFESVVSKAKSKSQFMNILIFLYRLRSYKIIYFLLWIKVLLNK